MASTAFDDHLADRRFALLVQSVTDYAIYMLDPEGRIVTWNAGAERFKGYGAHEIVGEHFGRFFTPEDRADDLPRQALAIAARDGRFEAEGWRLRKDGSRFWAHAVLDPIRDEDGRLVGFAKITRDVTDRMRAQEELRATQAALLQSQKLQALGELAGGIAHDFNNLMTVMRGSADFLLRQPDLPAEKRNRYLHVMLETSERATRLTAQLLAFARRQPLEPEVLDLGVRLDALGEMLQRTLGGLYTLQLDLAPALWRVEIDPTGLETALLNAVLNARDAMPNGGTLRIATRNLPLAGNDMVELSVHDSGEGIAPDTIERVFEPFFTTKPTGKGTGLGLSQIHGFAEQSGGSVRIDSELGQGTVLRLLLPRSRKALPAHAATALAETIPAGLKVLLVEDGEHVRYFARQLLDDLGCVVMEAAHGEAALAALDAGFAPDLVFSDIVMPGMGGLALAARLAETHPRLPVLLASGYSSKQVLPGDVRRAPMLRKPYTPETLAAGINAALRGQGN